MQPNVLPSHGFPEWYRYNIKSNTLGTTPPAICQEQCSISVRWPWTHPGWVILELTEGVQQGTFLYNGEHFSCIQERSPTWPRLCLTLHVWYLQWMSLGKWPILISINTAKQFSAIWVIPRPEIGSLEIHTLRLSTHFPENFWRTSKSLNGFNRDWF